MHIGVLTHNYPRFPGDFSGTFVEALCEEFAAQGQQVTVWAPYDPAYKRSLQGAVNLQLYRYVWPDQLHQLGYMRTMQSDLNLRLNTYLLSPALFAAGIAAVLRQARVNRPDVLHAHWVLPNGFIGAVASRLLGIPLIVSVPGSDAQVAGKNPLFRAMARFAFNQASLLTANSAELRESVVQIGADSRKFDLILYGADPQALRPEVAGVAELRARLALPPAATVFLCVGRMVYKKGFDFLLRALAEPMLRERNVVAVMIGNGDQKSEWQTLARQLGVAERVQWVGNVPKDEIGLYYNLADVLINPSVSRPADGLNVCVLDAMSCGKPVVGSSVAGNDLAIVDGETGLIVPEQDATALATALVTLVDNAELRGRMGSAARVRIEEELGWPHLARRYIEHFQKLNAAAPRRKAAKRI
ncbi:MAG: glycosyltransferase [Chloroflexi bacterium]|nr:glycosyltransferase [Chloroflexota bacterium]